MPEKVVEKVEEKVTTPVKAKTSKKKEVKSDTPAPFEKRDDLKKIVLYTIIVNYGQGDNIVRILKNNHNSSAQFVSVGEGTATKQILDILSIEDNRKEIVYSLVREDAIPDIKRELEAYFAASKRNAGIAYTLDLNAVVGVKVYKFLTQTVRG